VRGNVITRLAKLDAGDYDALVLAAAGLNRLGLADRVSELLPISVALPAAGQGALGAECRSDDASVIEMLELLTDPEVSDCVRAERAVSGGIGADCSAPLGAYAVKVGREIQLNAVLSTPDGVRVLRGEGRGDDAAKLGLAVADQLKSQGALELLEALAGPTGES
jgi:hydroxymethylbilane synthase